MCFIIKTKGFNKALAFVNFHFLFPNYPQNKVKKLILNTSQWYLQQNKIDLLFN